MDLTIEIPNDVWSVITQYPLRDSTLTDILSAVIDAHTMDMRVLVDPYMEHERGTIKGAVSLSDGDEISFDRRTNKGSVWICFQEEAYYGCRDKDHFSDHAHKIPFTLDSINKILTLDFLDPAERDTDEEF